MELKNKKNIKIILFFIALSIVASKIYFVCLKKNLEKKPEICLTVFVHGTVGCSLNLLNPFDYFAGSTKENSRSICAINKYRNHDWMRYDQILGPLGLEEFDFEKAERAEAAYYIISAYDEVAHLVNFAKDKNFYATFGWPGLLTYENRFEWGYIFYRSLCDWRDKIKKEYGVEPIFRIFAHSHGGGVAALMAKAERELKQKLKIDLLFMLGTPMQEEIASSVTSKMFKNIIMGHSVGDAVQCRDYFSSVTHKSYPRMSDLVDIDLFVKNNPGYHRYDMQFVVNKKKRHINHVNMWFMGRSKKVFSFMDPLPLLVLLPLVANQANLTLGCTNCKAEICGSLGACSAVTVSCANCAVSSKKIDRKKEESLYKILRKWSREANIKWRSAKDKNRHIVFNYKNYRALKDAVFG